VRLIDLFSRGFGARAEAMAMRLHGLVVMMVVVASIGAAGAQLTPDFYQSSCPQVFSIVQAEIQKAVKAEKRMAASLVRLHFHDCILNLSHMLTQCHRKERIAISATQ